MDLPGYGYAKTSKKQQKEWGFMISEYVKYRQTLRGIILIIDIRRGIMELDHAFLDFYLPLNKPLHILLTKSDKLKNKPVGNHLIPFNPLLIQLRAFSCFRH